MNRYIIKNALPLIAVLFNAAACTNTVNTYENSLGIKPSVVAQIDSANYTTITWADSVKNFGTINEGDSLFIKFKFINNGRTALFISSVEPSCGCVIVNYTQKPIMPQQSGEVTATFYSKGHAGYIHKTLVVTTNTTNKTKHVLSFSGTIKEMTGAK